MNPTLNEKHRAELRASGIGDELIEKAGIRSVADDEIEALLGWKPKHHHWGTGWAIPFRQSGEVKAEYCRVKLDFPRNKDGKPVKYESPIKLRNRPYFPPGFWEALANARLILITEGEKKALSAAQAGFCCIGLVGVYGFQLSRPKTDNGRRYGQRELLPELAAIEWNGRQVVIVFDSDAAEKDGVKIAEHKLAEVLGKAGAIVKVVRLPADGDEKVGLDDYLVKHGVKGFNKILDDAKLAEEPPAPKALDWARICVDEAFTCPSGVKLRWWRDQFWVWFGKRYQIVPDGDMSARLLQWLDKHGADATPRLAHDVLECLRSEAMVPSPIEQPAYLDGDGEGNLIAMQNGLLNLDELVSNGQATLRPHTARWFSPQILPYSYDPKATCPNWLAFLADVFDGDEERIGLLQEWFGYCMTNDTSFQKIMLLEGPRRSGKGTTLRMLNQVVGEENVINPTLSGIAGQFALWGFLDKRVAVCADALLGHGERAMMVLERLLAISGEDSVEVHRKNLPSIPSVRLRVRFTLAVNELPRFGDNAGALASLSTALIRSSLTKKGLRLPQILRRCQRYRRL